MENEFRHRYQNIELSESARMSHLEHQNVHHKAIFDSFNIALDIERPYKEKG
jgi:hypothetical protein